ncbi:hypothetical protein FBY24_0128 [Cellulomonas sp. SLBN-39]|nr:hypothetical protein FBY24_0128 [Cellulomonas sp. SLBN-39]
MDERGADRHGPGPGGGQTTGRAGRRRRERSEPNGSSGLPVTLRAPRLTVAALVLMFLVQPSRHGSHLITEVLADPASRAALASCALALVGVTFTLLFARTRLHLARVDEESLLLVHQGMWRRRVVRLGPGHQVRLVAGPAGRALVFAPDGSLAAVLRTYREVWRRDDVIAALRGAGVEVDHEHRLNRAAEIEAAFPGSTGRFERRPVLLWSVVVPLVVAGVFLVAWFLDA